MANVIQQRDVRNVNNRCALDPKPFTAKIASQSSESGSWKWRLHFLEVPWDFMKDIETAIATTTTKNVPGCDKIKK